MALAIETPSRIWRRIKEGEARDADMPSLPSLPDLDVSGLSDLEPPSLSVATETLKATTSSSANENIQRPSIPVVPQSTRYPVTGKDVTPLPSGMSLYDGLSGAEHSELDEISATSHKRHADDASAPEYDFKTSVPGLHVLKWVDALNGPERKAVAGAKPQQEVHSDEHMPMDRDPISTGRSAAVETCVEGGSLPNEVTERCPKSLSAQKACAARRKAIPSPSLPPTSPADTSLPNLPDPDSRLWDAGNDHESTQGPKSSLQTLATSPISTQEQDSHKLIVEDAKPEMEREHRAEMTTVLGKSAFSPQNLNTTRGKGVRFSQIMNIPHSSATPSQTQPLHEIGQQFGELMEKGSEDLNEADDLATPLPRRKSFLLNIVQSTTRPRLANPTPYPKGRFHKLPAGLSPGPSRIFNTKTNRPRLSHPLSRMSSFIPATPSGNAQSGTEADDLEGVASNSFVSTASSHDLTVHHRANASFDPLTGPQGVGRFNAGKLNAYLHGLNRRLQQENELLVDKVRTQQMELESIRHSHTGRPELSGVMENDAEQWVAEKEGLEKKLAELERLLEARDRELADERALRSCDKERWKERMTEVEDGVGQIIADLEDRVQKAEAKAASLDDAGQQLQIIRSELESAKSTIRVLHQRAEQAGQSVTRGDTVETAPAAGESPMSVGTDVQLLRRQIREKDDIVTSLQASLSDKDKEVSSLRSIIHDLESSLRIARETIEASHQDAKDLRSVQKELKEELRLAQVMVESLKSELTIASSQKKDIESSLNNAREKLAEKQDALETANERIILSSDELAKARANVGQLENALEESDRKIRASNDELIELRSKVSMMAREHEHAKTRGHAQFDSADDSVDVGSLKAELSVAMKEIGRLTTLLDQNPARKALDKARESRIDLLEKENQELLEQLRAVRDPSYFATPNRNLSMNGLTPMHRRLINLTFRTPKTPGDPLKNASWLINNTAEITTAQFIEEIQRLQKELDLANESIDDKLDKLEEAGLGKLGLTKALEDAQRRIVDLENELQDRDLRIRCPRCEEYEDGRFADKDASLQLRLAAVTAELESLKKQRDEELASASGERAVLRDATKRLNVEIKRAREELKEAQKRGYMAERSKSEMQKELSRAKNIIDDLEYYLQTERSRLRSMDLENSSALREKERILQKLHETEQRMEQARDRIFSLKEANIKLEAELQVQRKTSSIEDTLLGNRETIERLRQERSELSDKYYELQQQLFEASKNANELSIKHAKLQFSYDARRHLLDRQTKEIENLRSALSSQAQILDDARWNKENAQAESAELSAFAQKLQSELRCIQKEANIFGRDLIHLRADREQMVVRHREEIELHQCETNQIRAQLRNLKQQLANRKGVASDIHAATETLRLRHNQECKGLFVQIRYLKAKFTREAALRDDLGYQKSYLLVLLSRYEASEKRILATIAQVGFQSTSTAKLRRKSLRMAALAVIFISRARRASDVWREQRSACSAIAAALDDVRKNRVLGV